MGWYEDYKKRKGTEDKIYDAIKSVDPQLAREAKGRLDFKRIHEYLEHSREAKESDLVQSIIYGIQHNFKLPAREQAVYGDFFKESAVKHPIRRFKGRKQRKASHGTREVLDNLAARNRKLKADLEYLAGAQLSPTDRSNLYNILGHYFPVVAALLVSVGILSFAWYNSGITGYAVINTGINPGHFLGLGALMIILGLVLAIYSLRKFKVVK